MTTNDEGRFGYVDPAAALMVLAIVVAFLCGVLGIGCGNDHQVSSAPPEVVPPPTEYVVARLVAMKTCTHLEASSDPTIEIGDVAPCANDGTLCCLAEYARESYGSYDEGGTLIEIADPARVDQSCTYLGLDDVLVRFLLYANHDRRWDAVSIAFTGCAT